MTNRDAGSHGPGAGAGVRGVCASLAERLGVAPNGLRILTCEQCAAHTAARDEAAE